MTRLSAERVSSELMKLLSAPDPRAAITAMAEAGVLAQILPEARLTPLFDAAVAQGTDPVIRLMMLLPADEEVVRGAAARLRFANAVRDRLAFAAQALPEVALSLSDRDARATLYRHGPQALADAIRWRWAEAPGQVDAANHLLALAGAWVRPKLPVGGRDLERLGIAPGPETGRLLKAFEQGWIADDFPTTGHAERLKALVSAPRG